MENLSFAGAATLCSGQNLFGKAHLGTRLGVQRIAIDRACRSLKPSAPDPILNVAAQAPRDGTQMRGPKHQWHRQHDWKNGSAGLDYYYGSEKSRQFEVSIQPQFDTITTSIRAIRYAFVQKGQEPPTAEIDRVNALIDSLNVELYVFVRGFRAPTPSSPAV